MSQCTPFTADGPSGGADALGKVDCLASDATAVSFGRLFGSHGSFQTALTIVLTLYVALLAFNLLTGRSALRLSVLTPRMMTLGLVLTFATSWIAYQSVVWNLATGAPDEIASVLVGTKGSATAIFAERLDGVFNAITNAASNATPTPPTAVPAMVAGLGEGGAPIELKSAVSILVASIIYVALMLVVFKVAGTLTKGWRMGRAQVAAQAHAGNSFTSHQERPLNAAPTAAAA